jgi:hypothetical protein
MAHLLPETVKNAAKILGLPPDGSFTSDQVGTRWRELQARVHPDRGGSDALAAQVNAAREVLTEWLASGAVSSKTDARDERQRREWEEYRRREASAGQAEEASRYAPNYETERAELAGYIAGFQGQFTAWKSLWGLGVIAAITLLGSVDFGAASLFQHAVSSPTKDGRVVVCWPLHSYPRYGSQYRRGWTANSISYAQYIDGNRGSDVARDEFRKSGLAEYYGQMSRDIVEEIRKENGAYREAIRRGYVPVVTVRAPAYGRGISFARASRLTSDPCGSEEMDVEYLDFNETGGVSHTFKTDPDTMRRR